MVVVFADLAGFTRFAETHGDAAASRAALRFALGAMQIGRRHGLRPVKTLGDAVLLVGPDPAAGVAAASVLIERFKGRDDTPPAHVGVHAGPVVEQDGDVFGLTVNVAARLAAAAGPGRALVTTEAARAADGPGSHLVPAGKRRLRGLHEPVEVYELDVSTGSAA